MNGNDYFVGTTKSVTVRKGNATLRWIGLGVLVIPFVLLFAMFIFGDSDLVLLTVLLTMSLPITIAVGIVMMVLSTAKSENRTTYITDQAYDSMVEAGIKKYSSDPKEYLGLDDSEVMEIEPIEFGGYKFSGADKFKSGQDGVYRSNLYEKATIFFTRNEVHMYKALFNSISGVVNETTEVLFYSDIVSVSTDNETEKIGNLSINYLRFVLTSTGGKQFSVALLGNDNRQRSINAMRALIKEKKLK